MYILRAFALLLFLTQAVLAEQPTPILPDAKLTPGDKAATVEAGSVLVLFDDQSNMKIKTAGPATIPARRQSKIRS